jgi:mannosyl-3-phosphoglycerate phosphatase family protein
MTVSGWCVRLHFASAKYNTLKSIAHSAATNFAVERRERYMKKIIVFSDLDGTLLDASSYSFEEALPALRLLRENGIPLVLCSSKTKKEMEHYRVLLHNRYPFITENGGGIFIPHGYFDPVRLPPDVTLIREGTYEVIRLGADYPSLRKALAELREEGFNVTGFGDMTAEEVSAVTGLDLEQAAMAGQRDFDEPFLFDGGEGQVDRLAGAVRDMGFGITQGAFFHLLGDSDKGRAVTILAGLYREKSGEVTTIALGDSPNDIPMLECVDYPVLVKKRDGSYDNRIDIPGLKRAEGIGPEGWNRALMELLPQIMKN